MKGKFTQESVRGKICLLRPVDNEPHQKNQVLIYGINLIYGFISTVYMFYNDSRCKRLIKTMCPGKKAVYECDAGGINVRFVSIFLRDQEEQITLW